MYLALQGYASELLTVSLYLFSTAFNSGIQVIDNLCNRLRNDPEQQWEMNVGRRFTQESQALRRPLHSPAAGFQGTERIKVQ